MANWEILYKPPPNTGSACKSCMQNKAVVGDLAMSKLTRGCVLMAHNESLILNTVGVQAHAQ